MRYQQGGLAQLGERQDRTLKVRGSNPLPSTNAKAIFLCYSLKNFLKN